MAQKYERKKKTSKAKTRKKSKSKQKEVKSHKIALRDSERSVIYRKKKVDAKSKWVIFELADDVTFEESSEAIEQDILQLFGERVQYFIPVFSEEINGDIVSDILFDGYFFVKLTDAIEDIINDIRSDYIKGYMKKDSRAVEIPGNKINEFKKEMNIKLLSLAPTKKQIISPKIGILSNLKGEVISINRKEMTFIARFKCSTRLIEAPVNFINYRSVSPYEVLG